MFNFASLLWLNKIKSPLKYYRLRKQKKGIDRRRERHLEKKLYIETIEIIHFC